MITREQAAHIAQLTRTIRPAWDELTLINLIHQIQDKPLQDITTAAITAATNPKAETPRAINWPEFWTTKTSRKTQTGSPATHEICPVDGHSGWARNCPQCRSERIATNPEEEAAP